MKKIFSFVLTAVMFVALFSIPAFAATGDKMSSALSSKPESVTAASFDDVLSVDYSDLTDQDTAPEIIGNAETDSEEESFVRGDADGDGKVTVTDATHIQRFKALLEDEDDIDILAADADGDGKITVVDATRIQRYVARLSNLDGSVPYQDTDERPVITAVFEDAENIYSKNTVTVTVSGGIFPYQYKYTIIGSFHQLSDYGDDFGEYSLVDDEPGNVTISTDYVDRNTTTIPTDSLTYGDNFTLMIEVKDADANEAEPLMLHFTNIDSQLPSESRLQLKVA